AADEARGGAGAGEVVVVLGVDEAHALRRQPPNQPAHGGARRLTGIAPAGEGYDQGRSAQLRPPLQRQPQHHLTRDGGVPSALWKHIRGGEGTRGQFQNVRPRSWSHGWGAATRTMMSSRSRT